MTLLAIIQNVSYEAGLGEPPTTIIGNADAYVTKCLALLNKVGQKLLSEFDWQVLQKEQEFVTDGTGEYPRSSIFTDSDFKRYVNETEWNKTDYRKLQKVTAREWQRIKNAVADYNGYYKYFREQQNKILVYPDTEIGETLILEYISKNWVEGSDSTMKSSFTADDDTTVFDDYLLELGLKYELLVAYGQPAIAEYEEFEAEKKNLQSAESFRRDIEPRKRVSKVYDYHRYVPTINA